MSEARYTEVIFKKKIYVSGVLVDVGDTVNLHLVTKYQSLSSYPTIDVTVVRVLEGGLGIVFDRTETDNDYMASEIAGVHSQHDTTCPENCNFSAEGVDAAVAEVTVDGAVISLPGYSYPLTVAGALELQTDLREWLLSNYPASLTRPYITVAENTGELDIFIYGSVLDFQSINASGTPILFVNSCD